jgi:metal-responsive CopG/Arc/MetJ family transcriptional regulator
MFGNKIKLPADLLDRARRHAETAGFSSVDEFVARAVEKELERSQEEPDDEETRKRLEGLGYIS